MELRDFNCPGCKSILSIDLDIFKSHLELKDRVKELTEALEEIAWAKGHQPFEKEK
jgi:transcription initiation factor IIE alpha subunit